ncbi:DNA translocase SpoIIIE, partial [termite gut metagenome]
NTSAGLSPIEEAQTDTGEKETHTSKEVNNENFEEVDMTFEATESDDVPFSASQPYAGKTDVPLGVEISENSDDDDENYHGIETEPYNPKLDLEHYHFPTLDLLKFYDNRDLTINMEEQKANKEKIITTLRSFGIEISTIKATVGATVTLYEITPEQGVRISKIRGLEDDIALSLSALGIRIIAPIPGKGTIGIEVPNSNPKIVSMQSIIGSKKFQESNYD